MKTKNCRILNLQMQQYKQFQIFMCEAYLIWPYRPLLQYCKQFIFNSTPPYIDVPRTCRCATVWRFAPILLGQYGSKQIRAKRSDTQETFPHDTHNDIMIITLVNCRLHLRVTYSTATSCYSPINK